MSKILVNKEDLRKFYVSDYFFDKMLKEREGIFPIIASQELAGLVADLMGDGHLQIGEKNRLDFTSKSKKELKRFESTIYNLFSVKGKIRPCTTNKFGKTFNYGVNCKPIALILYLIGVPKGAKVLQSFKIPSWILEDKEYFRIFVYRLFCCEGTVDYSANPFIEISMNKEETILDTGFYFFNTIKNYLYTYFNITTNNVYKSTISIRKDKRITQSVRLKIKRKEDIKRFTQEIGFPNNTSKKRKLICTVKGNI